ncbi:hypothetical protein [Euzebya tangerina]|uniref:hypothetical protein n=1 Tax=Euzebya tangerina TaxID=591198 RepID=UPI0013C2B23D|nr:hypothetical protein [Euzebya tangerina]
MATYEPSRFRITVSAGEVDEQVAVRPLVAVTRSHAWDADGGFFAPPLAGFHALPSDEDYVWYVSGEHLRPGADTDALLDHYPPDSDLAAIVAERPEVVVLPPEFFLHWADRFPNEASCADEAVFEFVEEWGPVGGEWTSTAEVDYQPRGWGDFTNPDALSPEELEALYDEGDPEVYLALLPSDQRLEYEFRNRDLPEDEDRARAEMQRHYAEVENVRRTYRGEAVRRWSRNVRTPELAGPYDEELTWSEDQLALYHGLLPPDRGDDPRHLLPTQMTITRGYAYDVDGIRSTLLGFAALFEAFALLAPSHLTEAALAQPPPAELADAFTRRGLRPPASTFELVSKMLSAFNAGARATSRLVLTNGEVTYGRSLPDTLHGTLAQLLRFASHGTPARRCQNETCGRFFGHQQGRAEKGHNRSVGVKYCTPRCARAQASREWRRRQRDTT